MMGDSEGNSADAESRTPGDDSPRTPSNAAVADDADVAQLTTSKEDAETPDISATQPIPIIYKSIEPDDVQNGSEDGSVDINSFDDIPQRATSPAGSFHSDANLTPSVLVYSTMCHYHELPWSNLLQGSRVSSPGSSVLPSVASRPFLNSPTPSFRPFDRRFQTRISSSSSTPSLRGSSPGLRPSHSRNFSLSSSMTFDQADSEVSSPPWEVVRWTRLMKLNGQLFSEAGKRNFGTPTCLAVGQSIVIGTSKGIILVFDYSQNLKIIIGPGSKAVEAGAVTSVAISADHTTVAGGHANGDIYTWDTSRPARPFLSIPHLEDADTETRTLDGHVPNVSVVHLGFLGTRHTALVSADDRGMAFSHLATRGTGALGRTVKTTRILGRYPGAPRPGGKSVKPSTVLAFAPLPLGNVERATDSVGLTAMLTPYLLVIVSTTPVAQTQHKSARPRDVQAHTAMTGCLAWFPAVKLKVPDVTTGHEVSRAKLVYCWSNVLTVLDVEEIPDEDKDQPPTFKFKARSRWKCEEPIAAVQWISRSVLTVLTISQRLIVLEDRTMRMTEAFDLLQKHIYHTDLYSKQLHNLVEQLDEEDTTMHGVVADAFHMSFKAYKGRIFTLGFTEVSLGALSNWADRLIAMMEHGDYIGAIQLATSYYTGDADKLTVGLPEDPAARHTMVQDKVMEIVRASLKYAFSQRQQKKPDADDEHLKTLAETCFTACLSVKNIDFLLDDMFEWYEEADAVGIFLETLEPYILDNEISMVPPIVVKELVNHYVSKSLESQLEEMICQMETATLDLDQLTTLCKQHSLYDALIYVWNRAMGDYITPLIDLLGLVVPLTTNGEYSAQAAGDDYFSINAVKIFPYVSYTLTGRVYPNGEQMTPIESDKAMAEMYWFFFSGQSITWPRGSGREFLTRPNEDSEPAFPYLRLILKYDAPSFLSALNEAFEDPFLNDSADKLEADGSAIELPEEQIFGQSINRQYVVSILLDVMNPEDFAPSDTIYLDMFIARNLPKFPQYLLFSGTTLSRVLKGLCSYPGDDLAEDAQLSAEYLLSVHQPSDMAEFMILFRKAGFFRILKRIFKVEKQLGQLIDVYFEDPSDQEQIFDCIGDYLRAGNQLNSQKIDDVWEGIRKHAKDLLALDAARLATILSGAGLETHVYVLESAQDAPDLQFVYLKSLLEPERGPEAKGEPDRGLVEHYIQLMCRFNPSHVTDYINTVQSLSLRLDKVLPTMESTGVLDAAVVLLVRDGQVHQAMDRLLKHLTTLESALMGLLDGLETQSDGALDLQESAEDILGNLQKYVYVGIWLCKSQSETQKRTAAVQKKKNGDAVKLSPSEQLWLSLVKVSAQLIKRLSSPIHDAASAVDIDEDKLMALLRSLVQHTFTSLLTATTSQIGVKLPNKPAASAANNVSFLRILRAFLAEEVASSPNLAELRGVLASIFSAYAYEESILRLSNRLLERNLFVNVRESVELRQRGWRPRGSACEACGKRVWGPGVAGGSVFEAWEAKQALEEAFKKEKQGQRIEVVNSPRPDADSRGKGKGKGVDNSPRDTQPEEQLQPTKIDESLGPLVLLACRHIYHQSCLDALHSKQGLLKGLGSREYRCPIDG